MQIEKNMSYVVKRNTYLTLLIPFSTLHVENRKLSYY